MSSTLEEQVEKEQDEFEGKTDETVEDMAETQPEPTPPMQIPIEGLSDGITATPGGDRPKTASVTLRGGKLNVSGEFKKGDMVELYVRCRIAEVHFVDTVDAFGEITGTERKHVAKPVAVQRLAASEV
jgi:hypothetical protein